MAVVSERFRTLAESVAKARKVPDFPIVVLPANIEDMSNEELRKLADDTFPRMIEGLTGK